MKSKSYSVKIAGTSKSFPAWDAVEAGSIMAALANQIRKAHKSAIIVVYSDGQPIHRMAVNRSF